MRVFRGNVGVELNLNEFATMLEDNEQIDDLLNLIYELEMDEAMNFSSHEFKKFEEDLIKEAVKKEESRKNDNDITIMKRALAFLDEYSQ